MHYDVSFLVVSNFNGTVRLYLIQLLINLGSTKWLWHLKRLRIWCDFSQLAIVLVALGCGKMNMVVLFLWGKKIGVESCTVRHGVITGIGIGLVAGEGVCG